MFQVLDELIDFYKLCIIVGHNSCIIEMDNICVCPNVCVCICMFVCKCRCVQNTKFFGQYHIKNGCITWKISIESLPDVVDESLLLDESPLLESLDSLLSLLDELEECRLRLFDFFFLPFFEPPPSLRESAFVLPLIADDASPRLWSAILILSAKINRLITMNKRTNKQTCMNWVNLKMKLNRNR